MGKVYESVCDCPLDWKSTMEVQSIHGVLRTEFRDDSPVRTGPCLRVEIVLQDMHIPSTSQ